MSLTCPFCNASIDAGSARCPYCNGAIDAMRRPGERIAERFLVHDVLGAGPLGVTYRVRDLGNHVDVALLAIADELCPTEADRLGFLSRIEMFAGRTIAGCVMPLEVGADDEVAFVTSPIVEGVTLRAVLGARAASRQPLAHEEALRIMMSLAASTSALHSATPHGGLCPDTVLVTARGLLLIDCTVALAVPLERFQPRIQRFARAVPFVSPEAARGKRISAVADLYALGAIATELLTGSPLMRALDAAKLPPTLEGPLRQLLDREAGKRPGALGALLDALARSSGLERRPPEPPLPVPEVPSPAVDTSRQAAADWAAFAVSTAPVPSTAPRDTRREQESTVPHRRNPTAPQPIASGDVTEEARAADSDSTSAMPTHDSVDDSEPTSMEVRRPNAVVLGSSRPVAPIAAPSLPGRLAPATAPMPAVPRASLSGPPPSIRDPMRSGPPAPARVAMPSLPSAQVAPQGPRVPAMKLPSIPAALPQQPMRATNGARPAAPGMPQGPSHAPSQPRRDPAPSRDLDGIDPRLLRAARRLEAERRTDSDEDVDVGEIELIDD